MASSSTAKTESAVSNPSPPKVPSSTAKTEASVSSSSPPKVPSFSNYGLTSDGGFYAKNNHFQRSGPTDAIERFALENGDMYMRVDMPGVPKDHMTCWLNKSLNNVHFVGLEPKEWEHEKKREYSGYHGLRCGCCAITKVDSNISNGVLRMLVSKKNLRKGNHDHTPCCQKFPHRLPVLFPFADPEKNPYQTEGPSESFKGKKVKDGFYVRVDMPGVIKEEVQVRVEFGCVFFSGEGKKESEHDECGRTYRGSIGPFDVNKIGQIKTEVKNGVLRMFIPAA